MELKRGKKAQVTIFIIVAILIVAIAVLVYFLFPGIRSNVGIKTSSPSEYIDTCMREKIEETIETIFLNGGSYIPNEEMSYFYLGNNIEYLCYTNEYYKPCVVQQPLLLSHVKNEIKKEIEESSVSCFESLVADYVNQGYDVNLIGEINSDNIVVEIIPERTVVRYNTRMTITKGESENYENFQIIIDNNLYQILGVAMSIVEWEEEYGDAPTSVYMDWYHNLKIEHHLQSDGTTLYIITDRDFGDVFQFVSRSVVLPPGY